jgi:hypothetical protein
MIASVTIALSVAKSLITRDADEAEGVAIPYQMVLTLPANVIQASRLLEWPERPFEKHPKDGSRAAAR